MSARSHTSTLRPIALAAIISAAVGAPTAAHAQTGQGYRVLLNPVAPTSFAADLTAWRSGVPVQLPASAVTGERALLARTAHGPERDPAGPATPRAIPAAPVDGARALLGRWSEGGR